MSTVVALVGNPRAGSRTRTAAEQVADRVAERLAGLPAAAPDAAGPGGAAPARGVAGRPTVAVVDLADLATELFVAVRPAVEAASATVASARVLVVATPVYKASYTGLLKSFLDLYGPDALAGVVAVPLVVSGSPAHALVGEVHLRPLLVELGATVPTRSLTLTEADLASPEAFATTVDRWLAGAAPSLRRAVALDDGPGAARVAAPDAAARTGEPVGARA